MPITAGTAGFSQNKRSPALKPVEKDTLRISIRLQARYQGDSIVLRWGSNNSFAWKKLNDIGYNIERLELDATNKPESAFKKLNSAPVKPWTEEEWKKRSQV